MSPLTVVISLVVSAYVSDAERGLAVCRNMQAHEREVHVPASALHALSRRTITGDRYDRPS